MKQRATVSNTKIEFVNKFAKALLLNTNPCISSLDKDLDIFWDNLSITITDEELIAICFFGPEKQQKCMDTLSNKAIEFIVTYYNKRFT
jgi:hypothetical protein